jgi:hypothetical protein
MGKKIDQLVDKVVRVVSHPYTRRISKFASAMLETANYVDFKNPVSVAVGALSAADASIEAFELPLPTKMDQWVEARSLIMRWGFIGRLVVSSGLTEEVKPKIVCLEDKVALKEMEFDFGKFFYVEHIDKTSHYEDDLERICAYSYSTEGFDFQQLFQRVWDRYENGIYISILLNEDEYPSVGKVRLHNLSTEQLFYLGEKPDIGELIEEIQNFREKNISRSYILVGVPGTGKTSFAIQSSKAISSRILKIDPSVAKHLGSADFEFLIKNLAPDVLLFDDFDRATSDPAHLLFLLENIKQQFPKVLIFATVNDFRDLDDALKRPGRFDKTLWFDLPDSKDREIIAAYYLDRNNVKYNKRQLNKLVKSTENMSPAYIKELCIRLHAQGWEYLGSVIEEFKKTLGYQLEEEYSDED